jgi:hypothetical protein
MTETRPEGTGAGQHGDVMDDKLVKTMLSIKQLRCRGCKRPLRGRASMICTCCATAYCLKCAQVVTDYLSLTKAQDQCLVKGWDALLELARRKEFEDLERDPDEPLM